MKADENSRKWRKAIDRLHGRDKAIAGVRTPITCSHCGGYLLIIDDAAHTTLCESCGCRWETRMVPMFYGLGCHLEPEFYPPPEEEGLTPEERLRGL